jgi:hypothetical protein
MTKCLSLVFNEDLHRDDVERFKTVPGCTGVSVYRNTLNVYFRKLDRLQLIALASAVHTQLAYTGADVLLKEGTLNSTAKTSSIYEALRQEAES